VPYIYIIAAAVAIYYMQSRKFKSPRRIKVSQKVSEELTTTKRKNNVPKPSHILSWSESEYITNDNACKNEKKNRT